MYESKSVYLLTGRPGVGKTTLLRRVVAAREQPAGGFYTEELEAGGPRRGYRLVTLDGEVALLAELLDAHQWDRPRLGSYRIHVDALDQVAVPALWRAADAGKLLVVDGIGKMQLFSDRFRESVMTIVEAGLPTVGSIMQGRNPFADRVKRAGTVQVIHVTDTNREAVLALIRERLTVKPA